MIEARDALILAALAVGETRSEALAAAVDVPVRSMRRALARLRAAGLVAQGKRGEWALTGAGRRAALTATVPEPTASLALLDELPTEHRAMLRLIEDAVVARRALRDVYPSNWPGFVLYGPTKSGKTLIGQLAGRRFALDPDTATIDLEVASESSLLGRLEQDPGRVWRRTASPLAWPLVVLDKYSKAPRELRPVIFAYLAGKSRYSLGEETIEVHPTAIVTLNDDDGDLARLLPNSYLRRSVTLDTAPLWDAVRDIDVTAAQLARVILPQVRADLTPPAPELPGYARDALRSLLQRCLTDRGWGLVDVEAVSRLVLGRWATLPGDLKRATSEVAADFLCVTDTRGGLVQPDWPSVVEQAAGSAASSSTGVLAAARARHVAAEQQQVTTARAESDASRAMAGERERMLDALDHAMAIAPGGRTSRTPNAPRSPRCAARPATYGSRPRRRGAPSR